MAAHDDAWLAEERVARSRRVLAALAEEVRGWLDDRRADGAFALFTEHFRVLDRVLGAMVDAVRSELDGLGAGLLPSGRVYERCRAAEERISLVRRTYEWYASRYDQRLGGSAAVLRAADEVVRSCWTTAFRAVDQPVPSGPLVHLDARFDAAATPRVSVPSDLRAPRDAVVGRFVRELPIPVIALPASCAAEPWWVVLAAHETGHHVQYDLDPGLVGATRDALGGVVTDDPEVGACWGSWAAECFADAFAALTVGPSAAWAVGELQHGSTERMVALPSASSRYPPVPVRVALLGELARAAGAAEPGPGAAEVREWLDAVGPVASGEVRAVLAAHLDVVRAVAAALVDLPVRGVPLRAVCGWEPGAFAEGGAVAGWVRSLQDAGAASGRTRPEAARHCIAAGVLAYRELAARAAGTGERADRDRVDRLRATLPATLALCGPPGHLAAAPAPDLDEVARSLVERLGRVGPDGAGDDRDVT